jgi:hypothetical protein
MADARLPIKIDGICSPENMNITIKLILIMCYNAIEIYTRCGNGFYDWKGPHHNPEPENYRAISSTRPMV